MEAGAARAWTICCRRFCRRERTLPSQSRDGGTYGRRAWTRPITRLLDDPEKNVERWKKLTYLIDYQDAGTPKPGATVLADLNVGRRTLPLLVTQSYGHGRTAILATGGTWRWQMSEALGDPSHDLFWQQLLRWLVAESPGQVGASIPSRVLMDEGHVQLTAQVRDRQFQAGGRRACDGTHRWARGRECHGGHDAIAGHTGSISSRMDRGETGPLPRRGDGGAGGQSGQKLGSDALTFQREDGVAENFHTEQNRRLLEQLASATGGRYWKLSELKDLPRDISYSEAGISVRSTKELWNMPIVFLLSAWAADCGVAAAAQVGCGMRRVLLLAC